MRRFHLATLLIAVLSAAVITVTFTGSASACPGGYVRCGGACCPGR